MTFSFNQLSRPLSQAVNELGFDEPTEIQNKAIPLLLNEDIDFVGQAQTGTGKTAAFCLPLLERIDFAKNSVQALILVPTRELANQITKELLSFSRHLPLKTATVYGGVGYKDQIRDLKKAQIVVATPGRAIDLLEKGKLPIEKSEYLIIDEADEMLKMGFIDDVELLMDNVSTKALRWMFSATMPKPIVRLMEEKLNSPEVIAVKSKSLAGGNVSQSVCRLNRKDFTKALKAILLTEENFFGIVFCETKEETKNLCERLASLGKRVVALHGDLNQRQRDLAMDQFKSRKADILVCTDVASRGLDVNQITHVINMGLPRKHDSYVHRIGRTGRAGQSGKAISFVSPSDMRNLKSLERTTNQTLKKFELPSSAQTKKEKVTGELEKMERLKKAILKKGEDFGLDESFELFKEHFSDMDKEDLMKLFFSYTFNNNLKSIEESLENLEKSLLSGPLNPKRGKPQRGYGGKKRKGRRAQGSYRRKKA